MARRALVFAAAPVALVALAVAGYLVSPFFIRPTLIEESPFVGEPGAAAQPPAMADTGMKDERAGGSTPTTPTGTGTEAPIMADKQMAAASEAAGPHVVASGTFDQKDAVHKGMGTAILARTADGKAVVRFEDFSVTNGPDLFVYLSGHPRPSNARELHQMDVNLGRLKAPQGAFSYEVDPSVDLDHVRSVVVYCRAFSVVFSSAELVRQ